MYLQFTCILHTSVNEGADCFSNTCVCVCVLSLVTLGRLFHALPMPQAQLWCVSIQLSKKCPSIVLLWCWYCSYISYLFLNPLLTLRLLCHNCPMPRYVCKPLGTCVRTTVHAWRLQLSHLYMSAGYTSMCLCRCQMVCGKTMSCSLKDDVFVLISPNLLWVHHPYSCHPIPRSSIQKGWNKTIMVLKEQVILGMLFRFACRTRNGAGLRECVGSLDRLSLSFQ